MARRDARLYLEATVVFSGIVSDDDEPQAPAWMLDAVNRVENGDFFVRLVDVESAAPEKLKDRDIFGPLQQWLDGLDADEVQSEYERGAGLPQLVIDRHGWEVIFEAWPVSPQGRGNPDDRILGIGQIEAGRASETEQLHSKLTAKAGRYGRPRHPLMTAVLCTSMGMQRLDIEQALFGREAVTIPHDQTEAPRLIRQRDGFWIRNDGPQNRRVSAVFTAVGLQPWNAPEVIPTTWINPWADKPLREEDPERLGISHGPGEQFSVGSLHHHCYATPAADRYDPAASAFGACALPWRTARAPSVAGPHPTQALPTFTCARRRRRTWVTNRVPSLQRNPRPLRTTWGRPLAPNPLLR